MASSSDWLAEAQRKSPTPPAWVASLSERGSFVAGLPFAQGQGMAQPPPPQPQAAEEPLLDAQAQAFAEGEAAGRAAALAEAEQVTSAQRSLRLAFRALDQAAMDALAADLAETVTALCGQVIDENKIDRTALAQRCLSAAERIGAAADQCILHLHPEDLASMTDSALEGWRTQADPALERGGVRVEGPDGMVCDGPGEWRRAIAAALNQ